VNDSQRHAEELGAFLGNVGAPRRFHVNLIPYNAQSGTPRYTAPSHDACKAFKTCLQAEGLFVKIRETKGAEKMAACGQLGNVRLRRELNRRRLAEAEEAEGAERLAAEVAAAAAEQLDAPHVQPRTSPTSRAAALCGQKELEW
jgi:hypothetical protein